MSRPMLLKDKSTTGVMLTQLASGPRGEVSQEVMCDAQGDPMFTCFLGLSVSDWAKQTSFHFF